MSGTSLRPGSRLGPYELVAPIGAGGMGEVWRAIDTRLERSVAVKVLPPEFAADEERVRRFEREAKAISSLSHPHICALHDVGCDSGTHYLVLELVEGPTLAMRLLRGPLPLDELLAYGAQIAEALDAAHRRGIVHRDLKPGNVMLTKSGAKLLDFGLARTGGLGGDSGASGEGARATESAPLTGDGRLFGTLPYMAPEQVECRGVYARTDIFALGAVLFEMASGRRAFEGGSTASLVSAILASQPPPVSTLRAAVAAPFDEVVRRCLEKDPEARWQSARDVAAQMRWIASVDAEGEARSAPQRGRIRTLERAAWVAAVLGLVLTGALELRRPAEATAERPVAHLIVEAPEGTAFSAWNDPAVSPDGRHVAFVATTANGESGLWLRPLDSPVSREIAGVKGPACPFWSPDGRSLAFFASGELRRVPIDGGSSQRICAMPRPGADVVGADWRGDTIVFAQGWDGGRDAGRLYSVSASGGEAAPLSDPAVAGGGAPRRDPGRPRGHHWPTLLPDGRHMLFDVGGDRPGLNLAAVAAPNDAKRLLPFAARARYRGGRLLFTRQGTLFAQAFDVAGGRLGGQPVAVANRLSNWGTEWDWGWFSASEQVLAFFDDPRVERELVWFDRKGVRLATVGGRAAYSQLALSPDEKTLAVAIDNIGRYGADLWALDLAPFGEQRRLTETHYGAISPVWSTDGRQLFYSLVVDGRWSVFRRSVQGPGSERGVAHGGLPGDGFPMGTTPDGRAILCVFNNSPRHAIVALATDGDGAPTVIREGTDPLDQPSVSPDGRWLAYVSGESGRMEVYVEPFGRPGRRVRVSATGGGQPRWGGDGSELSYVAADGWLMSAGVRPAADHLEVALPAGLFPGLRPDATSDGYAVTRDGRAFLVILPVDGIWKRRLHVIVNWPSLLDKKPGP